MSPRTQPVVHTTAIIGAGFTGLGTAIKLQQSGIEDLVILERSDRIGGTWRDATYPGAACDIPSLMYSFSFAPNPRWTRAYSGSAEIKDYIDDLATRHGLHRLIRFGTEVTGLRFHKTEGHWEISTSSGTVLARTVVSASGPLSDASLPAIRGIETFEGEKVLSARWNGADLAGKNVAVIGTGASGIQIIPELVKTADSVKVFQRTAGWVLPRLDVGMPEAVKTVFEKVPLAQRTARAALFWAHEAAATGMVWDTPVTTGIQQLGKLHLRLTVKDAWMRRQLTPDFRAGCKRMLMSSDYYPALQADSCKLITWPIASIVPHGIRTADGLEHHVDAIVFATGYDVHLEKLPFEVHGLGGQELGEVFAGHPQAYKSINVHGFPNLFLMTGPNSGPGHNSLLTYVEGQIGYAVRGVRAVVEQDLRYLDVKAEVQAAYHERIQQRLQRTTWMTGCRSWYLTDDGYNGAMYPGLATQYLRQMKDFRLDDYDLASHAARELWNPPLVG